MNISHKCFQYFIHPLYVWMQNSYRHNSYNLVNIFKYAVTCQRTTSFWGIIIYFYINDNSSQNFRKHLNVNSQFF